MSGYFFNLVTPGVYTKGVPLYKTLGQLYEGINEEFAHYEQIHFEGRNEDCGEERYTADVNMPYLVEWQFAALCYGVTDPVKVCAILSGYFKDTEIGQTVSNNIGQYNLTVQYHSK